MDSPFDTIVALITGTQRAAVAVLRVSGPEAWEVASRVFSNWPKAPRPKEALYGRFTHGDDGLALPFEEGRSYTGEQSVEFSVHGSPASVRGLLKACYQAGARPAQPGEFTLRAFQNGRIDLTQAEGVRDSVEALTDAQLRAASWVREGCLHDEVVALREEVLGVLAAIEASTDFSDEVGELDRPSARVRLGKVKSGIERLLVTAHAGRVLREGLTIAIVGLPNAGKSSLLNVLLGTDRAIVTEVPGTTRDTVEEVIDLAGVPCRLIDTAGLRDTDDPVERIGVERSRQAAARADIVWVVYDAAVGWTPDDDALLTAISRPALLVATKCDLIDSTKAHAPKQDALRVSSVTREGLEGLTDMVRECADLQQHSDLHAINARHEPLLRQAMEAVAQSLETLEGSLPDDLAAVSLYEAADSLGQITGETAAPDMIQRIFHDFCIGK